jgi:hypothetical protein
MIGMTAMIGFDRLCARRRPIGGPIGDMGDMGDMGLVSDVSDVSGVSVRYVHEIVHGLAHVLTDQVNFYAYIHTYMYTCTHIYTCTKRLCR